MNHSKIHVEPLNRLLIHMERSGGTTKSRGLKFHIGYWNLLERLSPDGSNLICLINFIFSS